ncbi:probable GMP synthase [glutamine-hydrolyzing] isoform X2 [Mangifera indica]|uniref:probable GMP synthase [glutamine-hydrolyzing] isoform X2 n=1 Tax=Mangifera indica TaxID=29780 RepID=UPI001CFBF09E|nr:probable GMP synthase [glutamine-hydrolyzing] isoform X2 [Mangifera indica]
MCSSKCKPQKGTPKIVQINGRPVLQPKSNQVPSLERRNSIKKITSPKSPTLPPLPLPLPTSATSNYNVKTSTKSSIMSPPISPKLKSPRPPAVKRGNEAIVQEQVEASFLVEAPAGSIAAARREQVAIMQEERKMKIAHYGRTKSSKKYSSIATASIGREKKRCSFITPNSDPIYVAYHDEEWGVPVHDDKLLFELLVLTGAQVGSDWTSLLKKRQKFREAFSGFDAEVVAKFNEKKIASISAEYGIVISQVRGVIDNSIRILEVKKEFGSFDKYLWGFVNFKPINTQYRLCNKIPVKTSKSESISKDMVKRGFRFVGPTVMHLFMQAAGLTNDHLITCPRHLQCIGLEYSHQQTAAPAS